MKLVSCHISGYGSLRDKDIKFDGGLTQICEPNGYGKTTLASFIKAMFYGLPSYRAGSEEKSERAHYYPFGRGAFGGSLTFESGGAEYRIERMFGEKSDKDDFLKVYKNGREYDGLGDDPGKAVFGMDRESFERTIFLDPRATEMYATTGMSEKLGGYADATEGRNTFKKAVDSLDAYARSLKAKRGEGGRINAEREKIRGLKDIIRDLEGEEAALEGKYARANELRAEMNGLTRELASAGKVNNVLTQWEVYDGMTDRLKKKEADLAALMSEYPHGMPGVGDIAEIKRLSGELKETAVGMSAAAFDGEKAARLAEYEREFVSGVPGAETLDAVNADIRERSALSSASAVDLPNDRERMLAARFAGLDEEKAAKARAAYDKCVALDRRIKSSMGVAETAPAGKKRNKAFLIAAAAFAAVALGGIGVCFASLVAGLVIAAAGAVGCAAFGTLYGAGGRTAAAPRAGDTALRDEYNAAREEVYDFLMLLGYSSTGSETADFARYEHDREDHYRFITARRDAVRREEERKVRLAEVTARLDAFFAKYGLREGDYMQRMTRLGADISGYYDMRNERASAEKNAGKLAEKERAAKAGLSAVYGKYGIPEGTDPEKLQRDRFSADGSEREIASAKKEAEEFIAKNGLTERPTGEAKDISVLESRREELATEVSRADGEISDIEDRVSELGKRRAELEEAEARYAEYVRKYDAAIKAKELLEQAEQNILDRYVRPVKDRFDHYITVLEGTFGEKASMDGDFRIRFESEGLMRSDMHLSAGQRAVCSLCFRLAMTDNMFGKEKPFVIMDDPFVELDNKHMASAAKALGLLAADRQIIYLCCHDSRKAK